MSVTVESTCSAGGVTPRARTAAVGCEGGGGEGLDVTLTMGTATTLMPRASVAAAAEFRVEESEVCIAAAVVEAGTVMMTVMSTMRGVAVSLPGATSVRRLVPIVSTVTAEVSTPVSRATFSWIEGELTVPLTIRSSTLPAVISRETTEASTPAAEAIELRSEVFLASSKSFTLPAAVIVSTTDPVEGGGDGGGAGQYPQVPSHFSRNFSPLHLVYRNVDVDNSALQNSGSVSPHGRGSGGGGEGGGAGQYPQVPSHFSRNLSPLHLVYRDVDVGNSALQNSGSVSPHGRGSGGGGEGDGGCGEGDGGGGDGGGIGESGGGGEGESGGETPQTAA
eukprot:scaffold63707_cov49-Phaeocystis_antarctica.AAC.1